ncbi:unnamed protein product [Microthlaspi erraticum]|uniref:FKB95-like N-terminal Kelch domain-containing protein n=1 Tax=Microthlaspi erraticum TaxID=1685480 RepID=A0A6D2HAX5_9BRAS|nr:unnamed protein product [Microthlaspi erraticum]
MHEELTSFSASVVDRKIYVAGRHGDFLKNSLDSFAVFDTATQIWDSMPNTCSKTKDSGLQSRSACFDGKFHVDTEQGVVAYNSKESRWDLTVPSLDSVLFPNSRSDSYCEIENVVYVFCGGVVTWYDAKVEATWGFLKGLIGLPKFPPGCSCRLVDYGGHMVVLWDEILPSSGDKMIWCAEIALERRENCEMFGKIEWFDHVLTVPIQYNFVSVLVATV